MNGRECKRKVQSFGCRSLRGRYGASDAMTRESRFRRKIENLSQNQLHSQLAQRRTPTLQLSTDFMKPGSPEGSASIFNLVPGGFFLDETFHGVRLAAII